MILSITPIKVKINKKYILINRFIENRENMEENLIILQFYKMGVF
jgi:hypothetical protein